MRVPTYCVTAASALRGRCGGVSPACHLAPLHYGLVSNEREEGFNWLTEQVNARPLEISAPAPEVTITNFDKAMKNAVKRVYPLATPQICIFHVSKNVAFNIKKKWNKLTAEAIRHEHAAAQLQNSSERPTQSAQSNQLAPQSAEGNEDDELLGAGFNGKETAAVKRSNRIAIDPHCQIAAPANPAKVKHPKAVIYELWG